MEDSSLVYGFRAVESCQCDDGVMEMKEASVRLCDSVVGWGGGVFSLSV